jgi:hypothetical protein
MRLFGSHRGDLPAPFGGALGLKCVPRIVRPAGAPYACGSGLRHLRFAPSFAQSAPKYARHCAPLLRRPISSAQRGVFEVEPPEGLVGGAACEASAAARAMQMIDKLQQNSA